MRSSFDIGQQQPLRQQLAAAELLLVVVELLLVAELLPVVEQQLVAGSTVPTVVNNQRSVCEKIKVIILLKIKYMDTFI